MILKNSILILSYVPYVYKDGGFCISINHKNKIINNEIDLTEIEIKELLNPKLIFKNETPVYSTLLDRYFEELLNYNI